MRARAAEKRHCMYQKVPAIRTRRRPAINVSRFAWEMMLKSCLKICKKIGQTDERGGPLEPVAPPKIAQPNQAAIGAVQCHGLSTCTSYGLAAGRASLQEYGVLYKTKRGTKYSYCSPHYPRPSCSPQFKASCGLFSSTQQSLRHWKAQTSLTPCWLP